MAAFMIVDTNIRDTVAYEQYKKGVGPLIARHGGEYLVRGGEFEVLEGSWHPTRLVVFRFPSRDHIKAFFADPDYQHLKALRHRVADSSVVIVDGMG